MIPDKIIKLVGSDDYGDIILGIDLLVRQPNYIEIFTQTFTGLTTEKVRWIKIEEYKFKFVNITVCVFFDNFAIYRINNNFVYVEEESVYYKSVMAKMKHCLKIDNRTKNKDNE